MTRAYLLFLSLIFWSTATYAQLLTSEPAFPTASDEVTITFDATEGTGGLADCGCDVYLHTGVITTVSTGPADWQYVQTDWGVANAAWQMTPVAGEANKYTFTFGPSLREYYGVPDGEEIEQIALVFRNGDGSLEGKATGGADIYYEVYADNIPLSVNLTAPLEDELDVALGEFITISAAASTAADISIAVDGTEVISETGVDGINYDLRALEEGEHEVVVTATDGTNTVSESFTYTATYRVEITNPTNPVVLSFAGAVIPLAAEVFIESDVEVTLDGQEVFTASDATEINTTLNVSGSGIQEVQVNASYNGLSTTSTFVIVIPGDVEQADPPIDAPHGITYLGDGSYFLQLFAPNKDAIFVLGDFNNFQASLDYQMRQSLDGNLWWLQIDGLTEGESYAFQYLVDGSIRVADPYSTLVLDAWNDPFIPEVTFPDLPEYPADQPNGIMSLLRPGAPEYDWQNDDYVVPEKENLIIYELLMRDFIERHDYQTLLDTLDYLERLGVNAVEFMPVNEFEGNNSWGYNPSFHMALDKYYGTPNDFKRVIDECHARGIAVIVDVVYNHAFSLSPLCQLYWDPVAFKPTPDNPWVNPDARHPFNVGYDLNHESEATVAFVDRVMTYWIEEFRIDGFRFDLSKGFTQNFTTDVGQWGNYDADRIENIKHYADVCWDANPDFYMILEHFAANQEEIELTTYGNGMLSWGGGGIHNQYLEAAMGYNSNLSGAFYDARNWDVPALIAYVESHDEERLMYKTSQFGAMSGDYNTRDLVTGLRRSELTNTFFYTVPGPKMLWQFGEQGYDFSINYCPNGTIAENCRVDPKPIRWDYLDSPNRQRLFDVQAALINLRRANEAVFSTNTYEYSLNGTAKRIYLDHPDMEVMVHGNFAVEGQAIQDPFPHTGTWYEFFSGDSLVVTDASLPIDFVAGEYRLYTTVRQPEPAGGFITNTREVLTEAFELKLFPNPATGPVRVSFQIPTAAEVQLTVTDLYGRPVSQWAAGRLAGSTQHDLSVEGLPAGMYLVQLRAGDQLQIQRLLVQ
ncbi:MAG: alpha-amylase family glycosyl hydrolase [Bacteroidota bacterium]